MMPRIDGASSKGGQEIEMESKSKEETVQENLYCSDFEEEEDKTPVCPVQFGRQRQTTVFQYISANLIT